MKNFEIDIRYVTSIVVRKEHSISKMDDETSEDFLIRKLKYAPVSIISTSVEDHPEFTKLREQLGKDGFISIERGWWNGDRVKKAFILNGKLFKKNDKFSCAEAMHYTLTR